MTQPQGSAGRLLSGRYRLNEVLGRGGMGTVWRAEDEMLSRVVAVKELRLPEGVEEDEKHRLIVRTLREAKATARIRHRSAVTVFDVVEEDERPWIVMELVESRSLAEVIKEDGPLTPGRAAEIALDVLGVLSAAHAHGILHRDVKPSNVLIGEDGRVVLTDFGIASMEGDASITSTGMLVGAPSYISPERARGQKPGPPADLWSLGGTLYAMVEGRPPYDRGSALATLTAVMTEDLPEPVKAGPLRPVIEGLLDKDPGKRLDASSTRSQLLRIAAEATARGEATTQQAVPVAKAAEQSDGRSGFAALLGSIRVGNRAEAGPEPVGPQATTPEAAVPEPRRQTLADPRPTGSAAPVRASDPEARRRLVLVVAALAVVLALVAGATLLLRDGYFGTSGRRTGAAVVTSRTSGAPTTPSVTPSGLAVPPQTPGGTASGGTASGGSTLPAGYTVYHDPQGFSLALPGWLKDAGTEGVQRKFEGNGSTLIIEWTDTPGSSAVNAWQGEEGRVEAGVSNYHRLQLAALTYRSWTNAADWEWTFGTGTTMHSLNRGFVTGRYGYAIYWTTPDAAWTAPDNATARSVVFTTFEPAG